MSRIVILNVVKLRKVTHFSTMDLAGF
jgi:hypothetical protein